MVDQAIFGRLTMIAAAVAIHESISSVALNKFQLAVSNQLGELRLGNVARAYLAIPLFEELFEENIEDIERYPLLLARANGISYLAKVNNASLSSLNFEFIEEACELRDWLCTQDELALFLAVAGQID